MFKVQMFKPIQLTVMAENIAATNEE